MESTYQSRCKKRLAGLEQYVVIADGRHSCLRLWNWDLDRVRKLRIPPDIERLEGAKAGASGFFDSVFVIRESPSIKNQNNGSIVIGLETTPSRSDILTHIWKENPRGVHEYLRDPSNVLTQYKLPIDQFHAIVDATTKSKPSKTFPSQIQDLCWVSPWLAIGVTSNQVVWIKDSSIMCEFDPWPPEEGAPRKDSITGAQEKLISVSANAVIVCAATDFGRLHVLNRSDMTWKLTLPLGEHIVSMATTSWKGQLVATCSSDNSVRIIDLATASAIDFEDYLDGETKGSEYDDAEDPTDAVSTSFSRRSLPCKCCEKFDACNMVSNQDFIVCRSRNSGRTRALSRIPNGSSNSYKRWTLVSPRDAKLSNIHPRMSDRVILLHNNFALAVSNTNPDKIQLFAMSPKKAARVGSFALDSYCVAFDVDFHKRNRVVALSASGTVSVFPFRLGDDVPYAARISFQGDIKPTMIATHAGQLAVADSETLAVFLRPGQTTESYRINRTFQTLRISSIHWHGPQSVVINGIEQVDVMNNALSSNS